MTLSDFVWKCLCGNSCHTEICGACQLTGISTGTCAMGVFTVCYYQTDNRSKILLLFNLFFFINKFHLVILMDHHFASITIAQ